MKISLKVYGSSKYWSNIYEANKAILKSADVIIVGQVLNLPVISGAETKPAEPATKPAASATPTPGSSYAVALGDSLYKIAVKAYGNMWGKIYEANKQQIKDPRLIYVGMVLVIPA